MPRLSGAPVASIVLALSPVSSEGVSVAYLEGALRHDMGFRFASKPEVGKQFANLIRAGLDIAT